MDRQRGRDWRKKDCIRVNVVREAGRGTKEAEVTSDVRVVLSRGTEGSNLAEGFFLHLAELAFVGGDVIAASGHQGCTSVHGHDNKLVVQVAGV